LLRILDALVDMGDRRSAALQTGDAFRDVRRTSGETRLRADKRKVDEMVVDTYSMEEFSSLGGLDRDRTRMERPRKIVGNPSFRRRPRCAGEG
jgi:hypothetical protein